MSTKKVHWLGGARTDRTRYLEGFPCCMSGWMAEDNQGNGTHEPGRVNCKRCLFIMESGRLSNIRAAAFDMLEALKSCEAWFVSVGADGAPLTTVRAALAKAEELP